MGNFDEYFPWDKGFGSTASSARWRKMAQQWAPDGVLSRFWTTGGTLISAPNPLSATFATPNITVQPGSVFIHGYYGEIQTAQTISVGASTGGTLLAKADLANEVCSIYYKDQALDYNNYEQDTTAWEIPLYLLSAGALVDLRTWLVGGRTLDWWAQSAAAQTVASGGTSVFNFMYPRMAYPGSVMVTGSGLVTFSDASTAQSAVVQGIYQYNQSDQQTTPGITPSIPGSGPAGVAVGVPVAINGLIPVTQGKKTVGWKVTAGTGPQISVSQMKVRLTQVATGAQTAS